MTTPLSPPGSVDAHAEYASRPYVVARPAAPGVFFPSEQRPFVEGVVAPPFELVTPWEGDDDFQVRTRHLLSEAALVRFEAAARASGAWTNRQWRFGEAPP